MSNVYTVADQIREARRIRVLEEFSPDLLSLLSENEQVVIPLDSLSQQQGGTITFNIPSIPWELLPSKDPFALSFKGFVNLDLNEAEELLKKVYDSCKDLLEEAWKSGFRHAIICGGKIVYKTTDIADISDETVKRIGEERDKACYVFSAPDVVEESVWTPISSDDFYPTLNIYLGMEDSDEKEIVENSSFICADLDTGNPFYKIFDANQLDEKLTKVTPLQMRRADHLGKPYVYYNKRVKMCVKDANGNINSIICIVRLVRDWDRCALLQTSPNRIGFVGRDIMRDLRIRLKLDPIEKTTQILDVSS